MDIIILTHKWQFFQYLISLSKLELEESNHYNYFMPQALSNNELWVEEITTSCIRTIRMK